MRLVKVRVVERDAGAEGLGGVLHISPFDLVPADLDLADTAVLDLVEEVRQRERLFLLALPVAHDRP